ncbi:MAG: EF-hand domain-containing protein [Stenotrophomonas sp.]|nr:EF-hand domain-containing protein [Xanthomonadales bacterium]MBN8768355.1 EF-hand domain-containing protein [Stenotrophomonas sp.]
MCKIRTPLILSAALLATIVTTSAFAQDAAQAQSQPQDKAAASKDDGHKNWWAELDVDGDGRLSANETAAMENVAKIFPAADADHDGQLTVEEYKAWLASNGGEAGKQ